MSKKILVIPILLLTFALISIPVMAAPATKVGATATIEYATMTPVDNFFSVQKEDHAINHVKEGISTGAVNLTIGVVLHEGTVSGEWRGNAKYPSPDFPWADAEGIILSKHVWTFTDAGFTGTFEGVTHSRWIGQIPAFRSYIEYHMVLHGTGDMEGQTLRLSYAGAPPAVLEGTLVTPK